jgi:AcrR family transcriptional regulator
VNRPRGRPASIDLEAVLDAALRVLDAEGVDAVTMRRLAAELDVSAMAVYRHVGSKEELLRLVAAGVVAVSDHVFVALASAGFEPEESVSLFMSCASLAIGAAVLESAAPQAATRGDVLMVSADDYPGIAAVAAQLPSRRSPTRFAGGLRSVISGYASGRT